MQGCVIKTVGTCDETVGGLGAGDHGFDDEYGIDGRQWCDSNNPNDVGDFVQASIKWGAQVVARSTC